MFIKRHNQEFTDYREVTYTFSFLYNRYSTPLESLLHPTHIAIDITLRWSVTDTPYPVNLVNPVEHL